ncbi:MAG: alpha/beta fold hydrolase, partial [Microcystaceae cyanobacterium]
DLPGYGESTGFEVSDYALENQVKLLHQFTDNLGIKQLDLAASSMGGAIAHLYSQKYPQQIRSLAFIGSPLGIIDWSESLKKAIINGINPFIPITIDQFDLEISLLFVTPPAIPDAVKKAKVEDYLNRDRHYQQVWNIVNLYDRIFEQTITTKLPTLILWGEADQIYNIRGAEMLKKRLVNSQLTKLPNAGHLLLIENADQATSEYLNFLRQVPLKHKQPSTLRS